VELIPSSQAVTRALLGGEVDFGNIAAPAVIRANLSGGDLVYVTGGANRLVQTITTQRHITSMESLRGCRLAMGSPGDIQDYVVRHVLGSHGLTLDRDVTPIRVKDQAESLGKLESAEVDAAVLSPPHEFEARQLGFNVLLDFKDLHVEYQLGGLVARRSLVAEQPEVVAAVVRAYVRGVHAFKTRPEAVVSVLRHYSGVSDEWVARQTHAAFDRIFQRVPLPTVKGLETIMRTMSDIPPDQVPAIAATTADVRWVQQLSASRYIVGLYRGR
jgi:ABC-type nitrate/sulfonate/bicarbonate transport system substrate-binding protein